MISKDELQQLVDKIDYEGGLCEFLISYTDARTFKNLPDDIYQKAVRAEQVWTEFENSFYDYCNDVGVEV